MGTKMAVAFPNIFKGKVETEILSQSTIKPLVWKRYAPVNSSCAHPPPGQLRGIYTHCQSRGSGISLPKGYPRAFDTRGF